MTDHDDLELDGWADEPLEDPAGACSERESVMAVEPGCTCGGVAACPQCQERDARTLKGELDGWADEPLEDPAPAPADDLVTYRVASPHKVHGVKRGGQLRLNPDDPLTRWLVTHGHLTPEKEG